jgi:uncharacterized protein with FMN-binding domain
MNQSLSALLATAMVALPVSTAGAAASAHTPAGAATARHSAASKPTSKSKTKSKPKKVSTRKIVGPVEEMQWGPVQVTLIVKGKRITDVQASAPMERARSQFINSQAIPWLRQEVLKAQSANIDGISGATMTSEAFYLSLVAALHKAHL